MRRLLATDLGIWPMVKNQEQPSDMMVSTPDYWARLADYLLLYDQIVIPTGNLQILSVLRFMLGDEVFFQLAEAKCIVMARFDQWFSYVGGGGVGFYRVSSDPAAQNRGPNLAHSHFQPLDQAIDSALIALNPPTTRERRIRLKNLLLDNVISLPTESILTGAKQEAYRDILDSPYLREFLSIRNQGGTIENLVGGKPDTFHIFNPHVPTENSDVPEIRAVLRVVFENFLLGVGGHTQVSDLTGDSATLSVLQAKGQRIGFSPHGRQAFAQLQRVASVPDLGVAFAAKQISAMQIMDLRASKHTQALRDWLSAGSPAATAEETVRRYVETIGKPSVLEALPAKALRFAVTTTWGALEPLSGAIAAFADTFLLRKWYPGKNPRLFMRQAKVILANTPIVGSTNIKGRNRNAPCSCGSGRRYKQCCGQLS